MAAASETELRAMKERLDQEQSASFERMHAMAEDAKKESAKPEEQPKQELNFQRMRTMLEETKKRMKERRDEAEVQTQQIAQIVEALGHAARKWRSHDRSMKRVVDAMIGSHQKLLACKALKDDVRIDQATEELEFLRELMRELL